MGLIHWYYRLKHFYNRLSNRVLWFLILLLIFLIWFAFYWYIFVLSLYTIEINSNVDNYHVKLVDKKLWKIYDYDCKNKKCFLKDLANLEYKINISKPGYNSLNWKLKPKLNKKISVVLTKQVILKPIFDEQVQTKQLTRKEKIELISKKHKNYLVIDNKLWDFVFSKNNWNLELLYNWNLLQKFSEIVPKEDIKILEIIGTNKYWLLIFWKGKYIINFDFLDIKYINLNLEILYLKKLSEDKILFVTPKGSFLYDIKTQKINYFNSLYDFVILKNWDYIWVLKDNLITQKKNLWFENEKWDILVYLNSKTKKARLLKNPWFNISKIYLKNNWVYVENDNWDIFEVLNYF
jgi:hypothetical protein